MKEIEVKARAKDLNVLKQKLSDLGCTFSEPLHQRDRIFMHKDNSYADKKGKTLFRLRDTNGKHIFNMKINLENELDNLERETVIEKPEQVKDMLEQIGFSVAVEVEKTRITCKYKDTEVCLDNVKELGPFIEVEKMSTAESTTIQNELFAFLESLGVHKEDQVFKGYDSLMVEKNKNSQ